MFTFYRQGHDGHHYVALMDTQALGDESRPRYRCAQYNQDEYSGEIKFALSSDSTCTNRLTSPTDGYETLGNKQLNIPLIKILKDTATFFIEN